MNMKKKVKCKCCVCGKTFLSTKSEKIFMKYYTAVVCNGCMENFADKALERMKEVIFGGKDSEREQENG